jgi:N-hydroxyarylamine O-acetyltransferase
MLGPEMIGLDAYLDRIGLEGPIEPSAETLRALHRAHLFAVPFENLDIHLGRPIVLDPGLLVRKVVADRRGGFCYELNGAFAELLEALGYRVERLAAGVMGDDGFGPVFDHLLLRVETPADAEPWLVDVGFGEGFVDPLRLAIDEDQPQANGTYRLESNGDDVILARRQGDGRIEAQYRFTLEPHALAEFAAMCRFHQTSPASHFTRQRVCSVATPEGRITLSEHALIETRGGERTIRKVRDDAGYRAVLADRFGIAIDAPWVSPLASG